MTVLVGVLTVVETVRNRNVSHDDWRLVLMFLFLKFNSVRNFSFKKETQLQFYNQKLAGSKIIYTDPLGFEVGLCIVFSTRD